MADSWVMLKGKNRNKWIIALVLLSAITMAVVELSHPGTMASIRSGIGHTITEIIACFRDVINSLRELVRDISDWLH